MPIGPRRSALTVTVVGLLASLGLARPARAQLTGTAGITGTTAPATLADGDIFIGVQQQEGSNLAAFDLARFFNKANCDCDTPVFIFYALTASGFAKRSLVTTGTVTFWVGSGCQAFGLAQQEDCRLLASEPIATFMALGSDTIPTTARIMSTDTTINTTVAADGGIISSNPLGVFTPTPDCTSQTNGFTQTVYANFDYGSNGTVDYSASQAVLVDLTPPPAPTGVTIAPGNEAITVRWTSVDYTVNMDLQGYQILCQRGGGLQVFADGTFTPYVKSCDTSRTAPGPAGLDPLFVCSPLLNRSDTAYRVKILQNGIYYGATVVAIDNSGNASPADVQFAQPAKTDSFWDVYKNGNLTNGGVGQTATPGAATGGFCAVGGDGRLGRWGAGAAATALVAAVLFRARRRRRR
jgi:hypothetical protein